MLKWVDGKRQTNPQKTLKGGPTRFGFKSRCKSELGIGEKVEVCVESSNHNNGFLLVGINNNFCSSGRNGIIKKRSQREREKNPKERSTHQPRHRRRTGGRWKRPTQLVATEIWVSFVSYPQVDVTMIIHPWTRVVSLSPRPYRIYRVVLISF